jgi:hypothetical protein
MPTIIVRSYGPAEAVPLLQSVCWANSSAGFEVVSESGLVGVRAFPGLKSETRGTPFSCGLVLSPVPKREKPGAPSFGI